MKNGVPFDVAFSVDDRTRKAWLIIFGEQDGGKFNWSRMQFEKQT